MEIKSFSFLPTLFLLALSTLSVFASDPSPLQDFCVSVNNPQNVVFLNGNVCKDPKLATSDDFFFSGLNKATNVNNTNGFNAIGVNVNNVPGLNTLGLSFVRFDFAPLGQNPPHTHPRGSEILLVQEGTLYVGFVSSVSDGNRLFTKTLNAGDAFVFPQGLIHFLFNPTNSNAVALAALSSQNPGVITIANSIFASKPAIDPNVLAKAFQLDVNVIKNLQTKF